MKELRPSFILSFMEKYNILTILAGRFLDLNVYVSDRSNPFKKLPSHISILRRIVYKYATGIIAQTETAADMIREKIKNGNVKVIPNPIKEINNSLLIKKEKIILNVGRLVNEKGQEYLLDAFAMIEDNEWELVILGEGPLRRRLMEKADRLRISSRLTMPGAVNNVDEWLSKSTIFAFPSISEGYPNALLEAMSAGLSCVSFDCNVGPRDIIENDKNGYLVPVGDIAMFSEKLKNLMDSDEVRDRVGIQAKLSTKNYSISVISSEYLRFCHS
jgi:GalNAc-alpha-(1->4)-GalNAc-alpha-(1->3)-diNAcBac-PP-undecaprenol alpha-1,4-N-acetyl-D-galactosaminyltransferase